MLPWDIFISHASEDKKSFVDPLAHRLRELAVRVWYDRFVLIPGDRLSEKIGEGLAKCRCGLLVISPAFIQKPWTKYELSGLVNRFVEEQTRLIPVWLGVSRQDVANFNPALADLFAIIGDPENINACALEVLRVVRPQLYDNLKMLVAIDTSKVRYESLPRRDLKDGPIRHHDLPDALLVRIQNIHFALRDVVSMSLETSIENFQRDLRPEDEVAIWERIVSGIQIAMDTLESSDVETKRGILDVLLRFSTGDHERVFQDADKIGIMVLEASANAWLNVVPSVKISDVENAG